MTNRELRGAERVIEWAVAPAPPLPPVAQTGAVAAFVCSSGCGPRWQRLALRALLAAIGTPRGGRHHGFARLGRLTTGRLAPLGEGLAGLAQLAYYGEPAVLDALGYRPTIVRR